MLRAAARAASLDERLDGAPAADTEPAVIIERMSRWCAHAAGGDSARFRGYLTELGLDRDGAERLVRDVVVPRAGQAPDWSQTLAAIAARARDGGDAGDPGAAAFGHLWTAAGGAARAAIMAGLPPGQRGLLGPGVVDQVVSGLIGELGELGGMALYAEFSALRQGLRRRGAVAGAYEQFIETERSGGLPSLVDRYPVLGRLAAQRVGETVRATRTLLGRLAADLAGLRAAFWGGADPGRLTEVSLGWSDRHQHGQTVARLSFSRGPVLAYKPRPVSAERALGGLLPALSAGGLDAPLAPGAVTGDGYGWAAWIEQRPCASRDELARFYQRSGSLLALAALLDGTDLIVDNLVAAGPVPAVVDAEMLAPPRLAAPDLLPAGPVVPADSAVQADLLGSVVDTGMLPWWVGGSPGGARDVSGLSGQHLASGPGWLHRNTADMIPVVEPRPARRARNAPAEGRPAAAAAAHVGDLAAGYAAAHDWLREHRAEAARLIGASGLFAAASRYTFRATGSYDVIARRTCAPEFLRAGIDRSLALDVLSNPVSWSAKLARLHARDPAGARAVIRAERLALERLDVPLFLAPAEAADLDTERGVVGGVFQGRPRARLAARLDGLTGPHRDQQVRYIRGCFEARGLGGAGTAARDRPAVPAVPAVPGGDGQRADAGNLEEAARRCADLIARHAVRTRGSVSWLIVGENQQLRQRQLRPIGCDLYSGRAGVGVFLAAAAARWDDPALAGLARDCLRPVARLLQGPALAGPAGALTGAPSAVYGLALAGSLLADDGLVRAARDAVGVVAGDAAGWDGSADDGGRGPAFDLASGPLGAALALAAAAGHGAGPDALTAAEALGKRVLAGLDEMLAGGAEPLPPGLAHGALGAALALDRLAAVAGDAGYGEAADLMLDRASQVLTSPAPWVPEALTGSWCAGMAGIGAAALALGERCAAPPWPARVATAGRRAASPRPGPVTDASACCGRAGGVELLLLAGDHAAARRAAARLVPADGAWALGRLPGVAALLPGFHRGLAGLGYTFLRAAAPDRLPSILTWR
jgi:type 2 lantibiotic biosynthesis protein LanM